MRKKELNPLAVPSKPIILASASPRREQLLRAIGIDPVLMPSHVDENIAETGSYGDTVCQLADRKAAVVYDRLLASGEYDHGLVIGADTIVVLHNRMLGKPANAAEALDMLMQLQGREHQVYTGVAIRDLATEGIKIGYRVTRVRMKAASRAQLARYVESGEPLDKAGAYGIQGLGAALIDAIEGCYFNVVGLPISLLCEMLGEFGVEVP